MSERELIPIGPAGLLEIYREVQEHHVLLKGRKIKYIDSHYDVRQPGVFTIQFRGWGTEPIKVFTVTNRDEDRIDLFEEVFGWLTTGRGED